MSIYSNITEQGLINLRKLAQQRKEQRDEKIKNRILKQTHDKKLAESLSPITDKLDEVNKTTQESLLPITKQLAKPDKKSEVIDGNTQTPAIENTNISRSLLDTLAFIKTSKNFFKLTEDGYKYIGMVNILNHLETIEFVLKIENMIYLLIFKHILLIQNSLPIFWIILKKKQYSKYFKTLAFMIIYPK